MISEGEAVLLDLLDEIEDNQIRWQRGGGASLGALVVTNVIKKRLKDGPRQHSVVETIKLFWRCSCTPNKWRPFSHDPHQHQLLANRVATTETEWGVRANAGGKGTTTYGPYPSREAAEEVGSRLIEGGGRLITRQATEWTDVPESTKETK